MKNLSKFDLTMIIIFVVVGLLGAGAWYYLSTQLDAAKQQVGAAASDFEKYSTKEVYLPTAANLKTLQADTELIKAQIDPLVHSRLQPENGPLSALKKKDTVEWKQELDTAAQSLNNAARMEGVKVPTNFYYGFSRYLSQAPGEEKTLVLSKQLAAIEEIANILIKAPVKGIQAVRRTYEEDPAGNTAVMSGGKSTDANFLSGNAVEAAGGIYTAYPFEIEFNGTTDNLRKVLSGLTQSKFIFVVRSLTVENSQPTSPPISDLDKIATQANASVGDSAPGAAAAAKVEAPPQFLFGSELLRIKARIDLIEWNGISSATPPPATGRSNAKPSSSGANQ